MLQNNDDGITHAGYFITRVELKDYNVMIDGQNFFDQLVKRDMRTYDTIQKIAIGQGDDYTTGCLLDYPYFKEHYKMIATDLSKQQVLDADPKAMQQINFLGNLERDGCTTIFFYLGRERNYFRLFTRNCCSIVNLFCFNITSIQNDSI